MSKWIIGLVAIACIFGFVYWQSNATKTEYINGLQAYRDLPGREYILERDCYIFKLKRHNTTYPLIGANDPGYACSVAELPTDVSDQLLGNSAASEARLLDIAKVGSRFKLVSVRRDTKRHQSRITYEILFTDEAARKYPRLDAYYLLDHSSEARGEAPVFVDHFAVQRVKK